MIAADDIPEVRRIEPPRMPNPDRGENLELDLGELTRHIPRAAAGAQA